MFATLDGSHSAMETARREFLASVAELLDSDLWTREGAKSLAAWLAHRFQVAYPTAREWVEQAAGLRDRPDLACAQVSCDQLKAVLTLSSSDPSSAGAWVEALPMWDISDLQREARKIKARELDRFDGGRYLKVDTSGKRTKVSGQLEPDEGALLLARLDGMVPAGTRYDELDSERANALIALVCGEESPRATVVLHVEPGDEVGALESGGMVGAETAERMSCDASVQTVTKAGIGRASRNVPVSMARQVRWRDKVCIFPPCTVSLGAEVHHRVHFSAGGKSELGNLDLLCRWHHLLVHEGGWSYRREPDGSPTFFTAEGRRFLPERAMAPPDTS